MTLSYIASISKESGKSSLYVVIGILSVFLLIANDLYLISKLKKPGDNRSFSNKSELDEEFTNLQRQLEEIKVLDGKNAKLIQDLEKGIKEENLNYTDLLPESKGFVQNGTLKIRINLKAGKLALL